MLLLLAAVDVCVGQRFLEDDDEEGEGEGEGGAGQGEAGAAAEKDVTKEAVKP